MFTGPFNHSIIKRAKEKGLTEIHLHNIRDYAKNKHKRVDDYAFGHGAGMVMMIQPIADLIDKLKAERNYDEVIFMTPDGEVFNQAIANHISTFENIILLCGHYKGIDERLLEHYITMEISIGDYVLSGGELAAACVIDSVSRLVPGVVGKEESVQEESFGEYDKKTEKFNIEFPQYTRPEIFE
jgi:tRNA (guanine37-N1)-methyltransferase